MSDSAVLGVIGVIAGAFIGAIASLSGTFLIHRLNVKETERNEKLLLYSRLVGLKLLVSQSVVSRFEALIHSDYHEIMRKYNWVDTKENELHLSEAIRWMHRSEDMVKEYTENMRDLFEVLGKILVIYKKEKDIISNIEEIYRHKTPEIHPVDHGIKHNQLEQWKNDAKTQISAFVDAEYTQPIERLLKALEGKIMQERD